MNIESVKGARLGIVLMSATLLSACALPVPLQVASWAADGISLLVTEKSLTDHGLSIIAQKDCALWRGLKGDDICATDEAGSDTVTLAALAPSAQEPGTPQLVLEEMAVESVDATSAPDVEQRVLISGQQVWSARNDADLYYVIGSFRNRDNARRLVRGNPDLGPAVMAMRLNGEEIYRVAVGPFAPEDKSSVRRAIGNSGFKEAWQVQIDMSQWLLASSIRPSTKS